MPLDAMTAVDEIVLLDRMADILSTPDRWCKGAVAEVRANGLAAHCLLGALNLADHGSPYDFRNRNDPLERPGEAYEAVLQALDAADERRGCLVAFNNALTTTHADILAFIAKVRAQFEERSHAV